MENKEIKEKEKEVKTSEIKADIEIIGSDIKDTNETKYKNKGSISRTFIIMALVSVAVLIIFQLISLCSFKKSQRETISIYKEHIEKADQCVEDFKKYALDNMIGIQEVSSNIVADSLIKACFSRNDSLVKYKQKHLTRIVNAYFNQLATTKSDYEARFLKDSLLLSAERTLLNGQTKNMIDLHLDKIEHEYSNITMWATIMTLVFLVFSFYSMFKLEEYIQKSKETYKDIIKIKDNSETFIEDAKSDIVEKINSYDDTAEKAFENINSKTGAIVEKYEKELIQTNIILAQEVEKNIKEHNQKLDENLNIRLADFNTKYDELMAKTVRIETIIQMYEEALKTQEVKPNNNSEYKNHD